VNNRVNRMRDCYVFRMKGKSFLDMPATRVAKYIRTVAKIIGPRCLLLRVTKQTLVFLPHEDDLPPEPTP
jgi:hypothetical protein